MTNVIIYAESSAASAALESAVRDGNGGELQVRIAPAGTFPESLDKGSVLLVSRGLSRRDVLRILGRCWNTPESPHVIFLDPHGAHDRPDPLELEPACAKRVLDAIRRAAGGRTVRDRIGVRFRPLQREPAVRMLGTEPIDEETLRAVVA